jgi:hypothetical protein
VSKAHPHTPLLSSAHRGEWLATDDLPGFGIDEHLLAQLSLTAVAAVYGKAEPCRARRQTQGYGLPVLRVTGGQREYLVEMGRERALSFAARATLVWPLTAHRHRTSRNAEEQRVGPGISHDDPGSGQDRKG